MSDTSPTIYLVRHAESEHNVTKDFSIRDPGLTDLGFKQASSLATGSFPALDSVAIILSSPLRRTIETTLAGFGQIIDGLKTHFANDTSAEGSGGAKLILDPDLQERSNFPCDTGSPVSSLTEKFPLLASLSPSPFEVLDQGEWFAKTGPYTPDDEAVAARAKKFRGRLFELVKELENLKGSGGDDKKKEDIVVVTHGVFMKFLSGDQTIDLPKAGWKAFRFAGGGEDLVPVEV